MPIEFAGIVTETLLDCNIIVTKAGYLCET